MKKIIIALLTVLMVAIFLLSAQPADDSSLTSSRFAGFAVKILFHHNYTSLHSRIQKRSCDSSDFSCQENSPFQRICPTWFFMVSTIEKYAKRNADFFRHYLPLCGIR